ncbi:PPE domain-containing protein [Nocardia caishijiensis]|uniref:PPE family protein n=1 Tax=Nocardia caishijiensis TaxID=184756 RepID=A0ABQ6YKG9_9NOCA|nr:PPE domain-containing protein [Nocardia caishijiensis]KAF0846011.1 PPE family protein [Nocardia caishijiensis]
MTGDNPVLSGPAIVTGITGSTPEIVRAGQGAATTRQWASDLAQSAADGAHDPAYIQTMENFQGISHQEIYDHAQQMQPGTMHAAAEAWKLIGTGMQFATMNLGLKVRKSAAGGWAGASADAMLAALDRFVGEMTGMQDIANGVGWRIESAALAAEAVKAAVPPPPSGDKPAAPLIPGLENPAVLTNSAQSASDSHLEAVWAMTNHYVPNYDPAGQGVPTFGAPTEPGEGASIQGAPGNSVLSGDAAGDQSSGTRLGVGDQPGADAGNQLVSDGLESEEANDDPSSDGASGNEAGSAEDNGGSADDPSDDSSTTAASTDPGAVGSSSGSPNSVGGAPGSGQSGSPGGAGASGGQAGAGVPGAGRALPGTPVAGPVAAVAGGPTGGAGGRAYPGMAGMPGAGAGRRQDDDERKTPDWLVDQRNTEELIGPREPTVPAVFGIDDGPVREGDWETLRRDESAYGQDDWTTPDEQPR